MGQSTIERFATLGQTWRLQQIFGGLENVGADDAWYATAIDMEYSLLHNIPLAGGVVDLFKCFDQVIRALLYCILCVAGIPPGILTAYIQFQEKALIFNSISGALGRPHRHKCGIPQGCPLSMLFVSSHLGAWVVQMLELGASPKGLLPTT